MMGHFLKYVFIFKISFSHFLTGVNETRLENKMHYLHKDTSLSIDVDLRSRNEKEFWGNLKYGNAQEISLRHFKWRKCYLFNLGKGWMQVMKKVICVNDERKK